MVIYLQYLFVRAIKSFGWGKICIYDNLDTTLGMRLAGAPCLGTGAECGPMRGESGPGPTNQRPGQGGGQGGLSDNIAQSCSQQSRFGSQTVNTSEH